MKRLYQNISVKLLFAIAFTLVGAFFVTGTAFADDNYSELLTLIYNLTLPAAIILGLFLIALSGYTIMTSQGNPEQVKKGKENLTSAIIGLVFILISFGILRVVIGSFIGSPGF